MLAYLLGSVAFGMVMARLFGLGDLRAIGSGNIGATNVLRTGNKLAALLTLMLDAGKGAIAVLLAPRAAGRGRGAGGRLRAFLGHLCPVWLGFRGGKGVATFLGTLLALCWPLGLACCATWLMVAVLRRYSSAAALTASALTPGIAAALGRGELVVLTIVLAVLIWIRHQGNIRRLVDGSETKIGRKSREAG